MRWLGFFFGTAGMGAVIVLFSRSAPPSSTAFAFWVNLFLMAWAVIVRAGTFIRLPSALDTIHPRELRFHRWLGVPVAREIFRRIPTNPALKLRGRRDLARLEAEIRKAEADHLLVFGVGMGLAVWAGLRYGLWSALTYTLFNILLNGYPVLVQRHNRARIQRIIACGNRGVE